MEHVWRALPKDKWLPPSSSDFCGAGVMEIEEEKITAHKREQRLTITPISSPIMRGKFRQLIVSCILASSICSVSLVLGFAEEFGVIKLFHPLFWFSIATGGFGVSGSSLIFIQRLWQTK